MRGYYNHEANFLGKQQADPGGGGVLPKKLGGGVQTSVKGNVYLLLLGRLQDCMYKEVASSKKYEFKTRVQQSVPYLLPQWI